MDGICSNIEMPKNNKQLFRVGFLLIDDFALMAFSSAIEPLRAANTLLKRAKEQAFYKIDLFSIDDVSTKSSMGIQVNATAKLEDAENVDILFVVGGGEFNVLKKPEIYKLLRKLSNQGMILGGVSGGPVTLALAGVMNNRRMTAHWEYTTALQELMPDILLENSLYVIDRDRYTCAGGVAPVDMMNAILTKHHGATFAQEVSDWFIHTEVRPSAGPQRSSLAERYPSATQPVILAIEAMQNHIADPLDLEQLARLSEISPRQLNRLFKDKLGHKTMEFYKQLRLQIANNLLKQSPMKIIEIAQATGFVSAAHFSASFSKLFGETPSELRKKG
ncbi:GlxA family transcriptional regulator [Cocleimonas sp. KMM 6892]|uniref:GlxA family transcriptional regulator n=2 Tax=Cocleimonas TaxID=998014 RepID=UPI002DBA89CB|nr:MULTISPECIES: GlxA family transcriptional regulator [unclassified Cocleimonas]MEB8433409.1 GlxA family transcriptional regulator [Cocleimonas sp. KMM 6892]MEC4716220.1 GlxA family transcriptional regulator [Cocleimonas sp. KMM 6895]